MKLTRRQLVRGILILIVGWALSWPFINHVEAQTLNVFNKRYVYFLGDMNYQSRLEHLLQVMEQAASIGYNGIVLGGEGYLTLESNPQTYFDNFLLIRNKAQELGLELIPVSFNHIDPSTENRDLSEAFPVNNTIFTVANLEAIVPAIELLPNPGFELFEGDKPTNWDGDNWGQNNFIDTSVQHSGQASLRIENVKNSPSGFSRIWKFVKTDPFKAYKVDIWAKTEGLTDLNNVKTYVHGYDTDQPLFHKFPFPINERMGGPIASTQDWVKYTIDFNSLNNNWVMVFFGIWSETSEGQLWLDDASVQEVGLYSTIRRASLPITVYSEDENITYIEGVDYQVGDQKLIIMPESTIHEGDNLKVSWYQEGDMNRSPTQASACNPEYYDIQQDNAIRLDELFDYPDGFSMSYDEWRVANWDPACRNAPYAVTTGGEYLAMAVHNSEQILKSINPNYDLYVWSDMFDPFHNAKEKYWMVNGPLTNSWEGLSPDTVILNWNKENSLESLQFFAQRGHKQVLANYYDDLSNVSNILDVLDQAEAQGVTGVDGFMYCTWVSSDMGFGDYANLQAVADMIKARGRWGSVVTPTPTLTPTLTPSPTPTPDPQFKQRLVGWSTDISSYDENGDGVVNSLDFVRLLF